MAAAAGAVSKAFRIASIGARVARVARVARPAIRASRASQRAVHTAPRVSSRYAHGVRLRPSPRVPHRVPRFFTTPRGVQYGQFSPRELAARALEFEKYRRKLKLDAALRLQRLHRGNLGRSRAAATRNNQLISRHLANRESAARINAALRLQRFYRANAVRNLTLPPGKFPYQMPIQWQRAFQRQEAARLAKQMKWVRQDALKTEYLTGKKAAAFRAAQRAAEKGSRFTRNGGSGMSRARFNKRATEFSRAFRRKPASVPPFSARPSTFTRPPAYSRPAATPNTKPFKWGPFRRGPSRQASLRITNGSGQLAIPSRSNWAHRAYAAGVLGTGLGAAGGIGQVNPDFFEEFGSNLYDTAQNFALDRFEKWQNRDRTPRERAPENQVDRRPNEPKEKPAPAEQKKREEAAKTIQRAYRAYLSRKRPRRLVLDYNDYERKRRRY
jgi:hypothetical protein